MIPAMLVILLTTASFFCFQTICPKILHREFDREYCQSIVHATHLEFRAFEKSLQGSDVSVDYLRTREILKSDFFVLCYLLKNGDRVNHGYTIEERFLLLYFRCQLLSFAARCLLGVGEKQAALRLIAVLQYFANIVGRRVSTAGFVRLAPENSRLSSRITPLRDGGNLAHI